MQDKHASAKLQLNMCEFDGTTRLRVGEAGDNSHEKIVPLSFSLSLSTRSERTFGRAAGFEIQYFFNNASMNVTDGFSHTVYREICVLVCANEKHEIKSTERIPWDHQGKKHHREVDQVLYQLSKNHLVLFKWISNNFREKYNAHRNILSKIKGELPFNRNSIFILSDFLQHRQTTVSLGNFNLVALFVVFIQVFVHRI